MKSKKIIIGSRSSKLALIYAEIAKNKIFEFKSDFRIENIDIKKITTKGDEVQNVRLSDIGGKGLFSKKIEEQLLEKKIDIAVHALKDMPSNETEGLLTNCFLERNDPREVLISRNKIKFNELKKNSIIGTSSYRREFQLKSIRADLNYKLIRGNVDTRIKKLNDKLYDAIILSYAGVKSLRLGKRISQIFHTNEIIPSAGQGVVALQCREEDKEIINLLQKINHYYTHKCVQAERNVLKVLEGDCETPVGVFASIDPVTYEFQIQADLFSIDGKKRFLVEDRGEVHRAPHIGKDIGKVLKMKSNNSYKK